MPSISHPNVLTYGKVAQALIARKETLRRTDRSGRRDAIWGDPIIDLERLVPPRASRRTGRVPQNFRAEQHLHRKSDS